MERVTTATTVDQAWQIVLAAAAHADRLTESSAPSAYALGDGGGLRRIADTDRAAVVRWDPRSGWSLALPPDDPRHPLIDLYLQGRLHLERVVEVTDRGHVVAEPLVSEAALGVERDLALAKLIVELDGLAEPGR